MRPPGPGPIAVDTRFPGNHHTLAQLWGIVGPARVVPLMVAAATFGPRGTQPPLVVASAPLVLRHPWLWWCSLVISRSPPLLPVHPPPRCHPWNPSPLVSRSPCNCAFWAGMRVTTPQMLWLAVSGFSRVVAARENSHLVEGRGRLLARYCSSRLGNYGGGREGSLFRKNPSTDGLLPFHRRPKPHRHRATRRLQKRWTNR